MRITGVVSELARWSALMTMRALVRGSEAWFRTMELLKWWMS